MWIYITWGGTIYCFVLQLLWILVDLHRAPRPLGFVHLGFEWPWGSYYATHVTHHCCIFLFSITQCSSYFLSPQNYCMCRLYLTLLLQTWMQILVLYERSYMHAIKGKLYTTKAYNKPASTGYKYVHIPNSQLRNITRACISLIMHKASSRHWLFPPPQGLPTLPSLPHQVRHSRRPLSGYGQGLPCFHVYLSGHPKLSTCCSCT